MATRQVTVCDVCESFDRDATRWVVQQAGGSKLPLDLCAEHAAPLEALLGHVKRPQVAPRAATAKRTVGRKTTRGADVVSMEDIENMKRGPQ